MSDLTDLVRRYVQQRPDGHGWERIFLQIPIRGGADSLPLSGTNPKAGLEEQIVAKLVRFIQQIDADRLKDR